MAQEAPADLALRIRSHFEESAKTKLATIDKCLPSIIAAVELLVTCFKGGNKVLLCGNGGSAADAQHVAAEFVSRLRKEYERPAMAALALTTDTSFLTAYANDVSYDGVFARQIEALGKKGDVVLGISTSGNSRNVLLAFDAAKQKGIFTLGLCGSTGKIPSVADVAICVPGRNTQFIQETHLSIEHILCELVEEAVHPK